MDFLHPVFQDMIKLGCVDQLKIFQAFQTYMELCEVQVLKDVAYNYSSELDIIYLTSEEKGSKTCYIPVSVKDPLTPAWIEKVLEEVNKHISKSTFILVIREKDSSAIHYKITRGLNIFPSPEETKEKKTADEKKHYLQNDLLKRKSEFYLKAKELT